MKRQTGFTLIELVLVITILGILAAFAVPRFVSISADARVANVNSLAGSLRSASALAYAVSLAQNRSTGESITVDGQTIAMLNRYPDAESISNTIVDLTNFTSSLSGTTIAVFQANGAATPASCKVTYTEAGATGGPTITVTASTANC